MKTLIIMKDKLMTELALVLEENPELDATYEAAIILDNFEDDDMSWDIDVEGFYEDDFDLESGDDCDDIDWDETK